MNLDMVQACMLSSVRLFTTLWTIACHAPLSMGFARQEYWSGLPFPSPGDRSHPEIEPESIMSPVLAGGFFTTSTIWKALMTHVLNTKSEFLREYSHVLLKDNTSKAGPTVIHCWKDQSLHIFHLSIGFWNTALITKDLILFASSS